MSRRKTSKPAPEPAPAATEREARQSTEREARQAAERETRQPVEAIRAAAFAQFAERGYPVVTVRDIMKACGLTQGALYNHFKSKDELLLAVLTDGQHRLLATLEARMARVEPGAPQLAAWIEGVMAQARNADAAENTRPFAINGARIADRFPDEWAASHETLMTPLRAAVAVAGGDPERDADAIYHVAFGEMEDALKRRVHPTRDDVEHLVAFAIRGANLSRSEPHANERGDEGGGDLGRV